MVDVTSILGAGGTPASEPSPLDILSKWQALSSAKTTQHLTQEEIKNQQLEQQKRGLELGIAHSNRLIDDISGVLKLPPEQQQQAALQAVQDGVRAGTLRPIDQQNAMPYIQAGGDTLRNWLMQHQQTLYEGKTKMEYLYGKPGMVNLGQTEQPFIQSQTSGAVTTQPGTMTRQPSSDTIAQQSDVIDYRRYIPDPDNPGSEMLNPDYNQKHPVSLADILQSQGRGNWIQPNGQAAPVPGPQPIPGGGNYPQPQGPVGGGAGLGAPAPGATLQPPQTPPGPVGGGAGLVAPAPGATVAAPQGVQPPRPQGAQTTPYRTTISPHTATSDTASAQLYTQHQQFQANYKTDNYPLEKVYQLSTTPGVNLGHGTDLWNGIYQTINSHTPDWLVKHGITIRNIDDVAHREEINKYLVQSMLANSPYASHSDMMLQTAASGSPNSSMSNAAVQDVSKAIIGLRRMTLAGYQAFGQKYGDNASNVNYGYSEFMNKWQKDIDPRAFMYDMMSRPQLDKLMATMKPAELEKFNNTIQLAKSMKMYDQKPPRE